MEMELSERFMAISWTRELKCLLAPTIASPTASMLSLAFGGFGLDTFLFYGLNSLPLCAPLVSGNGDCLPLGLPGCLFWPGCILGSAIGGKQSRFGVCGRRAVSG
jgi:hypothetical protein